MLPFNRLKTCRYGQMLYNPHDQFIGRSLDLYGEFSEGEVELFRQMVQPRMSVLEIGANIGAHTVFLAQQVGPRGTVTAFEPQRILYQTLNANLALNSITNVFGRQQAVGAEMGTIVVPHLDYTQDNNYGGLSLGIYDEGERVPLVTIDSLGFKKCHVMKIDVEGMEQAVLAGAVETIGRHKPVLYVENDRPDKSADLIRFIDSLGYNMFWHTPPLYNPQNFFQNANNIFGHIISRNMIGVHRDVGGNVAGFEPVPVQCLPAAP